MIEKIIESANNKIIKHVKSLKTKKYREKNYQYIIDGLRIVNHSLEYENLLEYIIVTDTFRKTNSFFELKFSESCLVYIIDDKLMDLLIETETPQGIIAVMNRTKTSTIKGSVLVLDRIQDPGNIGTLIRTADASGFESIIIVKGSTDPYSQKALRSSMGSIMTLNIIFSDDIKIEIVDLQKKGYKVYSAALEDGIDFKKINYEDKKVLIIGNEANGISEDLLLISDKKVFIPMIGAVESLNASIAGGILMFEMNKKML